MKITSFKTLLLCTLICLFFVLSMQAQESSRHVLVSVAPHKFFVEKIAGDTVTVGLVVPAGASAHTFEPTPKQMMAASMADIWFCTGEGFESKAIQAIKSYRPAFKSVDLRIGVAMITTDPNSSCICCHANSQDLHIWLSCRQAAVQASTIATALSKQYPEYAARYHASLKAFQEELNALDADILALMRQTVQRTILVSHPAYAYFCRDYALNQLSIEFEGKDPTPQQLNNTLIKARQAKIDKVFVQPQYSSKGARLIAKELNAQVISLDPYSEHYLQSMLDIAHQFATP